VAAQRKADTPAPAKGAAREADTNTWPGVLARLADLEARVAKLEAPR
jgi:hypothetical protein